MKPTSQYKSGKEIFNEAKSECTNSQFSMTEDSQTQTQTQTQTDLTTTENELTQIGDSSNIYPPFQSHKHNAREVAWARLIAEEGEGRFELFPRDSIEERKHISNEQGSTILGCLKNILPSDKFNEYRIGRNVKMDIRQAKPLEQNFPEHEYQIHQWAYSMISNCHCSVYCMIKPGEGMDVFIEDSSGNGTIINSTMLLKRGEKRLLHSGDEICLINPYLLRKKIHNKEVILKVQRRYTYVFINVFQQQVCSFSPAKRKRKNLITPFSNKQKGIVDVREMLSESLNRKGQDIKSPSLGFDYVGGETGDPVERVEQYYDFRDVLGTGTCGEVKRGISRETGKEYAIKIIKLTGRNLSVNMPDQTSAALQAEASILKTLDHPYIVKLYDVFITPGVAIYFIMELMTGGDLFDRIVKKGKYTEVESRRAMRRLLNSIYYLHEKKSLVHRDLKPENILCVSSSNDIELKLTDFGLAKNITNEGLKTFCGTPQYFAPEVLRRNYTIAGKGRYGKEADMWSLGVILYILLSGTPPFDLSEGFDVVVDGKLSFPKTEWKGISAAAIDLVRQLLMIDPAKRLSVQNACEHSWILMNDGDTHIHPLDNPVAQLKKDLKRKKEFESLFQRTNNGGDIKKSRLKLTKESLMNSKKLEFQGSCVTLSKQLLPSPQNLNSRSNNFREIISRSCKKEKSTKDVTSYSCPTTNDPHKDEVSCSKLHSTLLSQEKTRRGKIKERPKNRELSEDEIQSQFSIVESICSFTSSFGSKTAAAKNPLDCEIPKGIIINVFMPSGDSIKPKLRSVMKEPKHSEIEQQEKTFKNIKFDASGARIGDTSPESSVYEIGNKQPKRTYAKQTTLSGWFQKKELESQA